jgi:hypothetical protein
VVWRIEGAVVPIGGAAVVPGRKGVVSGSRGAVFVPVSESMGRVVTAGTSGCVVVTIKEGEVKSDVGAMEGLLLQADRSISNASRREIPDESIPIRWFGLIFISMIP